MVGQSTTVKHTGALMGGLILLLILPLFGCQPADDGIPSAEKKNASRLDDMAKSSGGDITKLSPTDHDYLVKEIAHGDENAAKMMLGAKAGTLGKRPAGAGGPPSGLPR